MNRGDGHSGRAPTMALVQMDAIEQLQRQVERLTAMLEGAGVDTSEKSEYVEPGPGSPRQYFSAAELAKRWGWGESKVYALTNTDLPRFKHGQLVRYHWAHVWAFEGKISWDTAHKLFKSDAVQEGQSLPDPDSQPSRVRRLS